MLRAVAAALLTLLAALLAGPRAEAAQDRRFWELPPEQLRRLAAAPQVMVKRTATGLDAYCRCPVVLKPHEIPAAMKKAIVAVEDRRFFDREGAVDLIALLAVARDGFARGASTIPMQLLKNLVLHDLRDPSLLTKMERKSSELFFSGPLRAALPKQELLAAYLNQIEFDGREIVGLYRAARHYFRKEPMDLTVYEAAMLAGMVQAPRRFNPLKPASKEGAHRRARLVLGLMVAQGLLTEKERRRAEAVGVRPGMMPEFRIQAQPFVEWVAQGPGKDLVEEGETIRFFVTIDPLQQRLAERRLADLVEEGSLPPEYEAAAVVLSGDGQVRAMIGATDWRKSQFNRAVKAEVQPGSTAKLPLLVAACEAGRGPDSPVLDLPVLPDWPSNGALGYRGPTSLREAVAQSRNAAAVRLAREVGVGRVAAAARRLGIEPGPGLDPGLVLGPFKTDPLTMTAAYAAVANGGLRVVPRGVLAAVDGRGRVLATSMDASKTRAIPARCVAPVRALLREVVRSGTGRGAQLARWAAYGKTGTTTGNADAWFIGWSERHVVGFWMGKRRDAGGAAVAGGGVPADYFKRLATDLNRRDEDHRNGGARPPPSPAVASARRRPGMQVGRTGTATSARARREPAAGTQAGGRSSRPAPARPPAASVLPRWITGPVIAL